MAPAKNTSKGGKGKANKKDASSDDAAAGDKGKGKSSTGGGKGLKSATSINVRHILVGGIFDTDSFPSFFVFIFGSIVLSQFTSVFTFLDYYFFPVCRAYGIWTILTNYYEILIGFLYMYSLLCFLFFSS
jgi:hypothetical protein